ncbi:15-hydroxyprostaglandin dehydrogenase [Thelonectria olida]|uniref:15-hydroxyprostaglandin dehydrogenase n=1 Tax=Thelonectria olida TaxID=1576542 RepID=A0A9P8WHQ4_9HYPO|nr:15-hydroxyprostaglandin dehydrogenase [Thelonectria olida]
MPGHVPVAILAKERVGIAVVYVIVIESFHFHNCDVSAYDSQARCFQEVWDKYGRLDALCANAGIVNKSSVYILDHRDSQRCRLQMCRLRHSARNPLHEKEQDTRRRHRSNGHIAAIHPHETYPEYGGAKAAVYNFVRATSRVLKIKETIRINCVLPGIVATKITPPEMVAAVSSGCLTPISTILSAYHKCLEDESLSGEAIECSAEKHLLVPRPEFQNGRVSQREVTVWDSLFKMHHHELSQLPDAIA